MTKEAMKNKIIYLCKIMKKQDICLRKVKLESSLEN